MGEWHSTQYSRCGYFRMSRGPGLWCTFLFSFSATFPFVYAKKGEPLFYTLQGCLSTVSHKTKKQKNNRQVFGCHANKISVLKICPKPSLYSPSLYSRNSLVKLGHCALWLDSFWKLGKRSTRSEVLPFPFNTILSSYTATVPKALLSGGVSITPSSVTWWTPVSWSKW